MKLKKSMSRLAIFYESIVDLDLQYNRRFSPLADLGGGVRGREGRTPPPGRPNSFDFMQFSGKFGVFTPPLEGSRPPLGKILDPPLQSIVYDRRIF